MAEYHVSESNYVGAKDINNVNGIVFEIITEVKDVATDYGVKPRCEVNVTNGIESHKKTWTLNKQNINYLVKEFGGNSTQWIGKKLSMGTETVKGNLAIRIKGIA